MTFDEVGADVIVVLDEVIWLQNGAFATLGFATAFGNVVVVVAALADVSALTVKTPARPTAAANEPIPLLARLVRFGDFRVAVFRVALFDVATWNA